MGTSLLSELRGRSLRAQLQLMMLALLVLSVGSLFVLHLFGEQAMLGRIRDYTEELSTAIEEAAKTYRAKGMPAYDERGDIDRIRSQRQTIETPNMTYLMTEILVHGSRLYIVEAETPTNVPPPAQFQASVQILDEKGERVRYERDGKTRVKN